MSFVTIAIFSEDRRFAIGNLVMHFGDVSIVDLYDNQRDKSVTSINFVKKSIYTYESKVDFIKIGFKDAIFNSDWNMHEEIENFVALLTWEQSSNFLLYLLATDLIIIALLRSLESIP